MRFIDKKFVIKMTKNTLRKVTSKHVAERAGVSQTTVSFVLNKVEGMSISAETRQRVLEAARELNYTPDSSARSLARGRSNNIALVVAQPHRQVFIDEYIPKVLTGIREATQKSGFRILVEAVPNDQLGSAYQHLLQSKEAAGVILQLGSVSEAEIDRLEDCTMRGMPIVSLKNLGPAIHSVETDKLAGVGVIVQHLIDLGHQHIACIPYAPHETDHHVAGRLRVYKERLHMAGLVYDDSMVVHGAYDPDTGYRAMQMLLQQAPRLTAVFAMNDIMAFGALRALQEHGLRVPEDVALVGFDDIRLSEYSSPPLTTMNEPDVEHGRMAAEMLLTLIRGGIPQERQVKLQTRLVVRKSCGAYLK